MRVYATATEYFNKQTFDCLVPQYYIPDIPDIIKSGFLSTPIYDPGELQSMGRTGVSASLMVKFKLTKVPFIIVNDKDVLHVLHIIDNYLEEVGDLPDPTVQKYIENVLKLRPDIYKLFRSKLEEHPVWKEAYMGQNQMAKAVTSIYEMLGMSTNAVDPIEMLRDPPIKIKEKETNKTDMSSTFGHTRYDV